MVAQTVVRRDTDPQTSLVLPDHLQILLAEEADLGVELEQLRLANRLSLRFWLRFSEDYQLRTRRIQGIEAKLRSIARVRGALERYDLYTPPSDWWMGFAGQGTRRKMGKPQNGSVELQLVFPFSLMPPLVSEKYDQAVESRFFERIVVVAPQRRLFVFAEEVDPIMVGFISTEDLPVRLRQPVGSDKEYLVGGNIIEGGCGFLIAQWGG